MTAEVWRPVAGYEGLYEVSDRGSVRSWQTWRGMRGPRLLTPSRNSSGHLTVSLHKGGLSTKFVHRLVAEAFLGPRPDGMETRHLDGDHTNNAVSNLAYGTKSENQQDSVQHGTQFQAAKSHCGNGHAFDDANTLPRRSGGRHCRRCHREWDRARRARLRATAECSTCDRLVADWPARDCETPEEHAGATHDCDCGETVTIEQAIADPRRHRRCYLIGARS